MSTETVGLLGSGAQDGCLDFHTALLVLEEFKDLYIIIGEGQEGVGGGGGGRGGE